MHRGYVMRSLAVLLATLLPAQTVRAAAGDVSALEARVAQLEAAMAAQSSTENRARNRLKVNGFLSAGIATTDEPGFDYEGVNNDFSHQAESILGLQLDGEVNDRTRAVVQVTARGDESFALGAEWAYIGYKPVASTEVRVGRQRYPFFMLSEYLEVGYSHPWARPPVELYRASMPSAVDAITVKYAASTGDWSHDLQAYWGASRVASVGADIGIRNSSGLGLQSSVGDWMFSVTASQGEMDVEQPFLDALALAGVVDPATGVIARYAGVGAQYDNGSLFLLAESTFINVDGFFPDTDNAYATLGYRVGKFMPHLTWATNSVTDKHERASLPGIPALCGAGGFCLSDTGPVPFPADSLSRLLDSAQDSLTAGVRYDIAPGLALKLDWTRVLDTHGTFGYFERQDGNLFYGARPSQEVNVYRFVVDAVF